MTRPLYYHHQAPTAMPDQGHRGLWYKPFFEGYDVTRGWIFSSNTLWTYTVSCIFRLMAAYKQAVFCGSSLDALRAFPQLAQREAGYQIDRVQHGLDPEDWKPMKTIGQGVREIRIRDEAGAFRVIYLATLVDAVYVLHCFQKKDEKTSKKDLDLARKRYRDLLEDRGDEN
jgi:phage-related protein